MEGLTPLAKGVEEKLERLKDQYESQLEGIRSRIDEVRRPPGDDDDGTAGQGGKDLQTLYKQAKEELGQGLAGDQKEQLDSLVSDMDRSHQQQMADMHRQHVDEVDSQVQEIRSTIEEIYSGQLELVKSELEQTHQVALLEQRETLDAQYKGEITTLETELERIRAIKPKELTLENVISKEDSADFILKLNQRLTEEHREIIRKIESDISLDGPTDVGVNTDAQEDGNKQSVIAQAGKAKQSLEQQCDEIATLRAAMLGEYERLLTTRSEVMASQSAEVETLQREMATIQQQYERQVAEFQTKVQQQTETSLESSHAEELEKMKQYYEEKVTSMEQSYTSDIHKLKQEHEELLARLQAESASGHAPSQPLQAASSATTATALEKQRQYVRKTMTLTAISDEEEDETPPSSPTGNEVLEGRIKALETKLKDREKIVDELKKRLEAETTSAEDLHGKLLDSNKTLYEYEESLKQKIEEIDSLRDQLKGKNKTIHDLESEKAALEESGEKGGSESKVIKELKERVAQLEKDLSASKETNKKIQEELSQLDSQHMEAIVKLKQEMDSLTQVRLEEAEAAFKIQLEEEMKQQSEEIENKFRHEIAKQSQEIEIYQRTEKELRDKLEQVSTQHEKQLTELKEKSDSKHEKYVEDSAESAIVVSEIQELEASSPTYSAEVDRDSLEAAIRENVRVEILQEYEQSIDKLKSEYESRISELNDKIRSFEAQGVEKAEVTETHTESERTMKESLRAEIALEYKEKLQTVTGEYEDKLKHLQSIVDGRRDSEGKKEVPSSPITRSKSVDSEAVLRDKDEAKLPKEYEGFVATIRRDYEDKIDTLQTEIAQYRSTEDLVPSTPLQPKSAPVLQMEYAHGDSAATQGIPERPSDESPEKQKMYDEIAEEFETSFKNMRIQYEKQIEELKAKITALETEKDEIDNKVREEMTTKYEAEITTLKEEYEETITKLESDVKNASKDHTSSEDEEKATDGDKITKLEEEVKSAKKDKAAAEQKVKADMFVWHEETVNQLKRKHEETITQLRKEYEEKMDLTREELQEEFDVERAKLEYAHKQEVVDLEDRYESLVEGIRTGGVPEVAEIVQEKFDMELEMAKTLMQQECDETIESETSRLSEQFDEQLKDAQTTRDEALEEQRTKFDAETAELRTTLLQQYESQIIEMQSQHQSAMTRAQLEFGALIEKVKSDSMKSKSPSPKSSEQSLDSKTSSESKTSIESKTSEESSEIEEDIQVASSSTTSMASSERSDKDDDDDKGDGAGKGPGGAGSGAGQTSEGGQDDRGSEGREQPDSSTEQPGETQEKTAGSSESDLVTQLRQELARKIVEHESTIAQLRVVQEEEMSQLEQILNEKEEDYRARISNLEQAHEQDILEYQDTIAKLKQGLPVSDDSSSEAMELAHQHQLQEVENRLVQKYKHDVENLETQHQATLHEMAEKHEVEVTRLRTELVEAQRGLEQYPDTITAVQQVPTFTAVSSSTSSKSSRDFMSPSLSPSPPPGGASQEVEEQVIQAERALSRTESLQGTGPMETQVFETRTSSEEKSDASLQGTLDDMVVQSLDTSMDRSRGTLRGVDDTADSELIQFSEEDDVSDKSTEDVDTTQKSDRSTPPALMQTMGYDAMMPGGPTVKSLDDTTESSYRAGDREEAYLTRIKELETEVQDLRQRLEAELSKQEQQMDRLDREKQEEGNLVAMLRADIERLNTDRESLQGSNEHLLGLLSDAVKTYMSHEELINKKLKVMMDRSLDKGATPGAASAGTGAGDRSGEKERKTSPTARRSPASPGRLSPARADDSDNIQETSILSNVTDEGLDLSQRIADSIFQGPELADEEEELMIDSGNRLRTSVTHLLDMIEETTNQLLESRRTQGELAAALEGRGRDLEQAGDRGSDLEERLREEVERKDYLALELNKAQGLVEGYSSENATLERRISELEEQKEALVLELETTKNRLLDMNSVQGENESIRREIDHTHDLMAQNLGDEAQASRASESAVAPPSGNPALMLEVTRLNSENREKDSQIKAAHERFESRIRDLETSGEDMEGHFSRLLDERKQEVTDLNLQVDALDKQLKAKKQFLEEQTGEREQEHEEYQKDLEKWKKMVHDLEKQNGSGSRLQKEVDELTEQLQSRVDLHSQALLEVERAQQEVRDKELSLTELKTIIQQLEGEVQERTTEATQHKQRIKSLEELLQGTQLSEEEAGSSGGEARETIQPQKADSLEFDPSEAERRERLVAQLTVEEEMRLAAEKTKEELVLEKRALQTQLNQNIVQLSDARNQLDKMRHRALAQDRQDAVERRDAERERMEEKEKEISDLKLQIELATEQVVQRDQQLDQLRSSRRSPPVTEYEPDKELEQQINALKRENKQLRERVQLSSASSVTDISGLSQNLLEEKNQEIDFMSEQILRLQTDLNDLKAEKGVENLYEEVESLKEELKQRERDQEGGQSVRVSATFTDHSLTPDASLMNVGASFSDKTSIQQEMQDEVTSRLDRMASLESEVTTLKVVVTSKEEQLATLQQELKDLTEKLEQAEAKLGQGEDIGMLQDVIQEKESLITQMTVQVDSLQTEVDNLSDFQSKLQEDFDTVQTMLEEKDREIESLHKELTDRSLESRDDHTLVQKAKPADDEEIKHEVEISRLKKELREKDNVIEEKLEELAEMTDKLELIEQDKPEETIQQQREEITTLKSTVEKLLGRPPSPPQAEDDTVAFIEKQKQEIEALKAEVETVRESSTQAQQGGQTSDVVERLSAEIERLKQQILDDNLPEDDKAVLIRELRLQNSTLQKQVESALKIRPPSPPMDEDDKLEIIHEQKREIETLKMASVERSEDEKSELIRQQEKEIGELKTQVEAALQIAPPPPPESEDDKEKQLEEKEREVTMLRAEMAKVTEAFGSSEEGKLVKEKIDEAVRLQLELDTVRQRLDTQASVSSAEESLKEKEKELEMKEERLKNAEEHVVTLEEELKSAKEVRSYEDEIELKEKEDEIEELQAELERVRSADSTLSKTAEVELTASESGTTDSKQLVRSMSFYKEQYEEKCSDNRQLQVSVDMLKQQLDKARIEQIEDPQSQTEIEMFKDEIKRKSEEEVSELKDKRDSLEQEVKELKLALSRFDQDPDVRIVSLEKELQKAKEEAANERMDTVEAINDLEKLRERKEKERRSSVKSIQDLESQVEEKSELEKMLTKKVKELTEELETVKKSKSPELKKSDSQEAFELGTDLGTLQQQVIQYKQQADKTKEVLAEKQKYQSQVVKLEIQYETLQKQLTTDVSALEEQLKFFQTHPEQDVWTQLKATQERLDKTSEQLQETSVRLSDADTSLNKVSQDLRSREDDLTELQQDLWKTSGQLSVTSGRLAETEEKLRLTVAQVTEREEQITQLQGELQHSQNETEQAQQDSSSHPDELERVQKQLKTREGELEAVKKSLKEAVEMSEQQLQMVETKDQEYVKLKLDIQQTIAAKDKTIRESKNKLKDQEQEVNKAKHEAIRAKQEVEKAKQEAEKAKQDVEAAKEDADKAKQDTAAARQEAEDKAVFVQRLTEEVSQLHEQASHAAVGAGSATSGNTVATLKAQLENQEEVIAELRKNEEYRKEETEAMETSLAEFRKQDEVNNEERDAMQGRIDALTRELEQLRSHATDLDRRPRPGSRSQSSYDQNNQSVVGEGIVEDVYMQQQEASLQGQPKGQGQRGRGGHGDQPLGYVSDQDDSGHQSLQDPASRSRDIDFTPEGQRSAQQTRGDQDSAYYDRTGQTVDDHEVQSTHSQQSGSQPRSPPRKDSSGSQGSQGHGSPHGSRGHRSPAGSSSSGSPRDRGLPIESDTRSSPRSESSASVPRFDMSTSPPVREPRPSEGSRSPQSQEGRREMDDGQSRSPSGSAGHRSPPGGGSPPYSGGHSPPHSDRSSGDDRRSPRDVRTSPRDVGTSPRDERRSPHDDRSPRDRQGSQDRDGYDRSPARGDARSVSRSDGHCSPRQRGSSQDDPRGSPRDNYRSPSQRRSPSDDETRSLHRDRPRSGQEAERPVTRSPPSSEGEGRRRQGEAERYVGEDGRLFDRDDNIRPRYSHSDHLESQPRSTSPGDASQRSDHRSRSTQDAQYPDAHLDEGEGHVPSDAERYIQQLRRELLITKTALMQIQKGGNLESESEVEDQVAMATTPTQHALQQEVQPGEAMRYMTPEPRDSSSPREAERRVGARYETLPNEDAIIKLQRDLARTEEELELFRTSSNLSARDFVQKVMHLKDELSSEHQRHVGEIRTRTQQEGDTQLEALRLRYEGELEQLRALHVRDLEQKLAELTLKLERRFKGEMNREKVRHQEEITLLRSRLGVEIDDVTRLGERQGGVGQDRTGTTMVNGHSDTEPMSTKLQDILRRLHSEGVQVLSISELLLLNRSRSQPDLREADVESLKTGWENERQAMISTIQSLKDLLAQTHKLQGLDKDDDDDDDNDDEYLSAEGSDWRAELLRAIGYVFTKERESQLAELRSHALAHPSTSIDEMQRLEQHIRNMESHHHSALDQIFGADRQSLLAEIRDLRAHAAITRLSSQDERQRLNEQLTSTDEQAMKKERRLKRQDDDDDDDSSEYKDLPEAPEPVDFISAGVQLLEFKIQQEKVLQEDLRTSLDAERFRASDLTNQLTREKDAGLELQSGVSGLQVQVSRLKESLEREQSRYVSVTNALEEEKTKSLNLSDMLEAESSKLWQAQQEIDELRRQHSSDNRLQDVEVELAAERELRQQLESRQEISQVAIDNLKQEVQMGKRHLEELEKALENEQHLSSRLQQSLDAEKSSSTQITDRERAYIHDLQSQLAGEQGKVSELMVRLTRAEESRESREGEAASTVQSVQAEKTLLREHLGQERALNHELKTDIEKLQFERLEAVNKLQKEKETVQRLRAESDIISDELRRVRSQEMQRDHEREVEKMADRKTVRDTDRGKEELRMKLHEQQLEAQRLSQKAQGLEDQLSAARENELKVVRELEQQKLRNLEVHDQRAEMVSVQTSPRKEDHHDDDRRERQRVYRSQLDSMCQSLHYLLLRYREQLNKQSHKPQRQHAESDDLEGLQGSLYDLRQELKQLQELEGDFMSHPSSSVNERVLRQNEELTNFVARISEEKTELRNALTRLEEEIWTYRKLDTQYQEMQRGLEGTDQLMAKERSRYAKEKLNLQLALNSAEQEIALLQADLRVERDQRVNAGTDTRDADKMKIQRLYGKFLRAESFRKALIYQKKYLLLLLGGFRDTEETTLSLLSRMGAVDTRHSRAHKRQPLTTFRGAVRVVVAISRMKYLVKKWKRATRVGSEVVGGTFDENEGYMPQSSAYSPPSPPRYPTSTARVVSAPVRSTTPISAPVRSTTPTLRASPRRQTSPLRSSDTMVYLGRRDNAMDTDGYSSSSFTSPRATTLRDVPFTPPTKDYNSSPVASYTSSITPGARRKLLTSGRIPLTNQTSSSLRYSPDIHRNGVSSSGDVNNVNDYAHRLENLQNRLGKLQNVFNLLSGRPSPIRATEQRVRWWFVER